MSGKCCDASDSLLPTDSSKKIVLVGNPNVGKSIIFNQLTNSYVAVSNYPGTTVTVDAGKATINNKKYTVVDTPGMYSFIPITEEEKVTRDLLLKHKPEVVLHIIDAKNIDRMLHLTIELIESGLPIILVLNMMDEAEERGFKIDTKKLEALINIPIIETVSTTGKGIHELKKAIASYKKKPASDFSYDENTEDAIRKIERCIDQEYPITKRSLALLLLQEDKSILDLIKQDKEIMPKEVQEIIIAAKKIQKQPIKYSITIQRQNYINSLVEKAVQHNKSSKLSFKEKLSRAMMNPFTGIPLLVIVLYFGIYQFVGVFGAGTVVNFLENNIFGVYINPYVNSAVTTYIPWQWLQELVGLDYGIVTLGIRYAIAIIFPIVATFFIMFSIIEDSGYLPRLAMLIDRLFKRIGLNGRAVIPMVLGFGCDTMATIVTRTQETKKERIITTLLLALAIPCSAQLGVIFAILSGYPKALMVWIFVMAAVFLIIGYLASKIIPGEKPYFYMEVPPLRVPLISNIITKTYSRMVWYFKEVIPFFILASVFIWFGKLTGLFQIIISGLEKVVAWIGLPAQTASVFLFGFFRRDYGAAGLYSMQSLLTVNQLVISAVTLTLFVPCIAQFSVMFKERGWKTALAIGLFIFPFAFFIGFLLNLIFTKFGVVL